MTHFLHVYMFACGLVVELQIQIQLRFEEHNSLPKRQPRAWLPCWQSFARRQQGASVQVETGQSGRGFEPDKFTPHVLRVHGPESSELPVLCMYIYIYIHTFMVTSWTFSFTCKFMSRRKT